MATTSFEILVGAREIYAAHPNRGILVYEQDGHMAFCSLGAIGKAANLKEIEYTALEDGDGIEEAVQILAKVIRESKYALPVGIDGDTDDQDVVILFNDHFTKDAFLYSEEKAKVVFDPSVKPAEEVLWAFDEAIKIAAKL